MTEPAAGGADADSLATRLLGALVSEAESRGVSAVMAVNQPPIVVVALPQEGAAVLLFDRGDLSGEPLQAALDRILAGQASGILHLVLCGGGAEERAILQEADRRAPDRNRLGAYHLDDTGRLSHLLGRKLPLLSKAGDRLARGQVLDQAGIAATTERAQRSHQEAVAFSRALRERPQLTTRLLLAICVIYYLASGYWSGDYDQLDGGILLAMGANRGDLVREHGQLWRLLSHAFLHAGLMHLAMNMIGLWSFGRFLESVLGWRRYLVLYGLSALAGGVASALSSKGLPSVGASGALFGLMGAGIGPTTARQRVLPPAVVASMKPPLMRMLILNVVISFLPGIDLFAHAGGGLLGFLLVASGLLTRSLTPIGAESPPESAPAPEPAALRVAALVMAAVLAGSLALALLEGRPWQLAHRSLALAL